MIRALKILITGCFILGMLFIIKVTNFPSFKNKNLLINANDKMSNSHLNKKNR
jgi:hypothetical protein